ncbi:Nn.00g042580.m01.CDS01 [Neocucurbitaria sp. VM-36]
MLKHGAYQLANVITNSSSSIFLELRSGNPQLRYMDIFRQSIEVERVICTNLLLALQDTAHEGQTQLRVDKDSRGGQRQMVNKGAKHTRRALNIQDDIEAVWTMQDIEEELSIILHINHLQMKALKAPTNPYNKENLPGIEAFKVEVNGLHEQAKLIHERLFQTLELKQALLGVRQNEIVLTFTVITIIFLPLGFISSVFGMNATELSDGSPIGLRRIFTYMRE